MTLGLLLVLGCGGSAPPEADLVLDGVSVLDVESGSWIRDRAVYVAGSRIVAVRPAGGGVPEGAQAVAGEGMYVIPGLWDAHVHSVSNRDWHFPLLLAHGVTAVRNMHTSEPDAFAALRQVRADIRDGAVPPLRFVANGPIVDGDPPAWPGSATIADPTRAATVVDSLVDAGADFIKVYDNLSRPAFQAVLEAARARGIPVDGHVPFSVPAEAAVRGGMRTVEHLSGLVQGCSSDAGAVAEDFRDLVEGPELPFPSADSVYLGLIRRLSDTKDPARCGELVETYAATGVAATPTLVNGEVMGDPGVAMRDEATAGLLPPALRGQWERMAGPGPGEMLSSIMRPVAARAPDHVRALHASGVPLLVGTDIGNPFIVPGASVHRELELLAQAGLSPADALRAATRTPARVFGLADSLGLVAPGFVADLVVLADDPLADLSALGSIRAVVLRGRVYDREELDGLLAEVQGRGR